MASQIGRDPHILERCWNDLCNSCWGAVEEKTFGAIEGGSDCFTLLQPLIKVFLEANKEVKETVVFQDVSNTFSVSFLTKSDGIRLYRGRVTCVKHTPGNSQNSDESRKSHVRLFQEIFGECTVFLSVAKSAIESHNLRELNTLITNHSFNGVKSIYFYIEGILKNPSFQGVLPKNVRKEVISEDFFKLIFPTIVFSDRRYGFFQAHVKTLESPSNTRVSRESLCWDSEEECIIDQPTHLESDSHSDIANKREFLKVFLSQKDSSYEISIVGCISDHLFSSVESILAYLKDPRLATVESVKSCARQGKEREVLFTEFPEISKDGRRVRINAYIQESEESVETEGVCWDPEKACLDCNRFNSIDLDQVGDTRHVLLIFYADGKKTTVIADIS